MLIIALGAIPCTVLFKCVCGCCPFGVHVTNEETEAGKG